MKPTKTISLVSKNEPLFSGSFFHRVRGSAYCENVASNPCVVRNLDSDIPGEAVDSLLESFGSSSPELATLAQRVFDDDHLGN